MFILLSYLVVAIVIGIIFVLLEQYNLSIILTIAHTKITMSAALACVAILLAIYVIYVIYKILKNIVLAPWRFANYRREKQKKTYIELLTRAIAAYFNEDDIKIKHLYSKLNAISDYKNSPALKDIHQLFFPLLSAKKYEVTGEPQKAQKVYEELTLSNKQSQKILGLHALFSKALHKGDFDSSVNYAREAFKYSSGMSWANEALLSYSIVNKDWGGAHEIFKLIEKFGDKQLSINKNLTFQKALLLAAQAQAVFANNPMEARDYAKAAQDIAKTHVGINALYSMILMRCNEESKALLLLENWWQQNPHPDYAKVYIYGQKLSSAQQLERAKNLEQLNHTSAYSALSLSEAYLHNNNNDKALEYVKKAVGIEPLRRCYLQQIEIEKAGEARLNILAEYQKLAKSAYDYAWAADSCVLAHWQPLSPKTKKLGAVVWQKIEAYSDIGVNYALKLNPLNETQHITGINVDDPGIKEE